MPVTPFHMGPGLLIKALLRGAFSLMVFGYAQVLMDLQPLVALTTGWGAVHGLSHTWLGGAAIGTFAALTGRLVANPVLRVLRTPGRPLPNVTWPVAIASAFIGTLSHVALDSLIYSDVHPFAPWSEAQPWLGAVTTNEMYLGCVVAGVLGAALYLGLTALRRERPPRASRGQRGRRSRTR